MNGVDPALLKPPPRFYWPTISRAVWKRIILAVTTVIAAGVLVASWWAWQLVAIGTAYKAKMLCSAVFVGKRDLAAAERELQVDDLTKLRFISAALDREGRSVTASALGIMRRRAVFRDGLGCALAFGAVAAPASVSTAPQRPDGQPLEKAATIEALDGLLRRVFVEPNPKVPRRTQAVLVLQGGKIVGERYAQGIGPDTALPGWSMAKSVINALVGVLVDRGVLKVDAPIQIPEFQGAGDPRAAITLGQLLQMSSGLEFDEGMRSSRSDVMRMLLATGDASAYAIEKKLIAKPGEAWSYSSGSTNIISRAIRNVLHDDGAYWNLPRQALFDRIGMSSATLEADASGTFVGSSFVYATARDWARFGQLYLQNGVWNGQRILPDGWVTYTTTAAPADKVQQYGAHFWLQVPEEYGSDLPLLPGVFHAAGHEGQFVTVIPSRDLVIVRLGHTRYPSAWDQVWFAREVLVALDQMNR